jgi:signal transduction histidine kinase
MRDSSVYFIDDNANIYVQNNKRQFAKLNKKANKDLLVNLRSGLYEPAANLGIAGYNYLNAQLIGNWTNSIFFLQTGDSSTGFVSVNKKTLAYVSHKKVLWIDSVSSFNKHVQHGCGVLMQRFYYLDLSYGINSIDTLGICRRIRVNGLLPDTCAGKRQPDNYSLLQQKDQLFLLFNKCIYRLSYVDDKTLHAALLISAPEIPNINSFRDYPSIHTYVVGTNTRGLFLFKKKQFRTLSFPETDNIFYAQAPYRGTEVLTHFGVLAASGYTRFPFDNIKRQAILKDKDGNYWLNKAAESIIKIAPDFKVLREIKLDDLYINSFAQTRDGSIWLVTNKRRMGKVGDKGIEWLEADFKLNAMHDLLPIDNENFWVGGNRNLVQINVRTKRIIRYNFFNDCDVRHLYLDKKNTLWIGTYGKGYFALNNKMLTRLPLDNKGNLNFVHALLEDSKGNVWITTNNGLLRARKQDLEEYIAGRQPSVYYRYYSREQGFNTNEFNGGCSPAGLELKDGKLSFPTMDGLVQFYPDSLKETFPGGRIFIDELIVDGKTLEVRDDLVLPPSFNRLELLISSPYYDNPANQVIEYKLKEFDDKWYPVGNHNTIVYNRLPYGNYELQLRAKTSFDKGYNTTAALRFTVKPFFYQEWYFKALAILLLVVLVLVFFRLRYFILIKKQRKLEHKVQQRTRELVYNNRLKEKLTLLIAHDLQSPLHFLTILARHVHKAAQNKDMDSVLEGSEEIKNTTAKIYAFVKEFSLWNMSLNDNYRLNKTSFPVSALIEELKEFFEEMLRLKNNTLELKIAGGLKINTDRDVLKAILRNVLDNANKYTQNGTISITASKDDQSCLTLSVRDTGNGMTEQQVDKLNYRIKQSPSIPAIEKDGRLGFQLIIDFAARLDAKLSISSESRQGTMITISGIACED